MKKKAVAFLLMCAMLFTLAGCSSAEMGYLNLSKEVAQMEGIGLEENVVIHIGEEFTELTGLDLGDYVEIQANGVLNEKLMAYDLNLAYRLDINSDFQPLTRLVMDKDAIIMSTEGLWKWLVMAGYDVSAEQLSPEFVADMEKYVAEHPYIKVSMADEADLPADMYDDIMAQSIKILDILTAYHENYTTGLVTEKDGGYAIRLGANELVGLVDGWLEYAQKDTANSFAMAQAVLAWLEELAGEPLGVELTIDAWQAALADVQKDWQSLKMALTDMDLDPTDCYDAYTKMTGTKGSRVVNATETLRIAELGLDLTSTAKSTEQAVSITVPTNTMEAEAYMNGMENIINRYTTVKGAQMRPINDQAAMVESQVVFAGQASVRVSQCDLKYIEQKYAIGAGDVPVILPTATVAIDGNQATVSLNGNSATIEGVMSGNMLGGEELFIPVRELAKVGVAISYTANPEVLTLTVQ